MTAFLYQIELGLRLNARNRMALIYGYIFPLIFLFSFWAVYRHDQFPLLLHMGELLTVTILGSACFGLPTTMVSERERGVWRRYRLTPAPLWTLLTSTLITRLVLLLSVIVIQISVAIAIGMPLPRHPAALLVALTFASFAFLGIGLLIAMLADTVPSVQALGQCIFLPMLLIGGIAVPLASLPDWALQASAYFPGRYAVKAIQDSVTGPGLSDAGFALIALLIIGAGAMVAALGLFRWDSGQRFRRQRGKVWMGAAICAWLFVGLAAEWRGRDGAPMPAEREPAVSDYVPAAPVASMQPIAPEPPVDDAPPGPTPARSPAPEPVPVVTGWQAVTTADFDQVAFDRLPPDDGLVAPIAGTGEQPDAVLAEQLETVRTALVRWTPGQTADPLQRVRNLLFVAAVPDLLRMEEIERFLPQIVYERLRETVPPDDLPKLLYWVAMHPHDGHASAVYELDALGLPDVSGPPRAAQARMMLYAFKFLGRTIGARQP